jgi:predicted exporter
MSSAVWVKLCGACGRSMEGATGCLGTVENRHAPSGYVMVKMVPEAELAREREAREKAEARLDSLAETQGGIADELAGELERAEAARSQLEAAVEGIAGQLETETGLAGRNPDQRRHELERRARDAARHLRAALRSSRGEGT